MEKFNLEEILKCQKCEYLLDEPQESQCCGDLYCQTCVFNLKFNLCNNCKKILKFRPNVFAKKLLQKVEFECRHQCGKKFAKEEMKIHLYRCENRIFKCTIEFCSFIGKKRELDEHMILRHSLYLLSLLESYQDFKEIVEKIIQNPVDIRKPLMGNLDFLEAANYNEALIARPRLNSSSNNGNLIGDFEIPHLGLNDEYYMRDSLELYRGRYDSLEEQISHEAQPQLDNVDNFFDNYARPEVNIINLQENQSLENPNESMSINNYLL